jgi:drug/metabolite transporter (DMT)-like permease
VAVALGYFLAGEVVTPRMLLGTALIVASVAFILVKDKAEEPDRGAELEEVA